MSDTDTTSNTPAVSTAPTTVTGPTLITVTREALKNALTVAAIGIDGGDDDKLGTHYVFRIVSGTVEVLAASTRVFASASLEGATVTGPDVNFTVPGWRLRSWLDTTKEDTVKLEYANAMVKLFTGSRTGRLASLDASQFPFWDQTLAGAKVTATVSAKVLFSGLDYAKRFVSDADTRTPNLCEVECRDGLLHATDVTAFSLVQVPGLEGVTIRINGKDVSAVDVFLSIVGEDNVEVLESDKCQFFRAGTRMVGVTRWLYPFPALKNNREDAPKCTFTVKALALREAIAYVATFAKKVDKSVYFSFNDDDALVVSVANAAGSNERDSDVVPCVKTSTMEAFAEAGHTEFKLSSEHLVEVLSSYEDEKDVDVGVFWSKKNGYIRVREVRDGIDYYTVIVWSK